jgi:hypothetical protein
MIDWTAVATNIVTSSVAIGVVGLVARSIFTHGMDKDLERYKHELKSKSDLEIERVKNELKMAELEHSVRFSRLHERRADVIATLYKYMVESYWAVYGFVADNGVDEQDGTLALKLITESYNYFEVHRLYLPYSHGEVIKLFFGRLRKIASEIRDVMRRGPRDDSMADEQIEKLNNAIRDLEGSIAKSREMLESEFRELLGARDEEFLFPVNAAAQEPSRE